MALHIFGRRKDSPQAAAGTYGQQTADDGLNAAQSRFEPTGGIPVDRPIGEEQVHDAYATMQKYKEGKANLERRIVENEQWYKLRHWECMRGEGDGVEPVSAWLFNSLANKHADAMDNFPSLNILPREEGDKAEAEMLSSIVPVILEQCEFEEVYDRVQGYKNKFGTGVYGVFWDSAKLGGLGDVSIRKIDLLNLFWEPGVTDIQKSRNIFHVELADNDVLASAYPQLAGRLGAQSLDVAKYRYDDNVDTTDKSIVVDWYYKRTVGTKTVLHYCKFCDGVVLFATENDPAYADSGWYAHGLYPFAFDTLFDTEGTAVGFGYIDVGKAAQEYIDRGKQAILENMLANARPRHFIRTDGSVNEAEYADLSKNFIHVDGNLGQDSIVPVQGKPLSDIYVQVVRDMVDELKEVTGNRDVSTGGTTGGVTAASAIAAMQEASGKLSRDSNKSSYRAFRKLCLMVIELIRQFYDLPRCFRIMGDNGAMRFVQYSNRGIAPQRIGTEFGVDMGTRTPLFDIEVTAQKQSPYSKMAQNEIALNFFGAGFFNPQLADQALACLDMMDFDRKQFVMQKIAENGARYQQMLLLAGQLQMAEQGAGDGAKDAEKDGASAVTDAEPAGVKRARQNAAGATSPR